MLASVNCALIIHNKRYKIANIFNSFNAFSYFREENFSVVKVFIFVYST